MAGSSARRPLSRCGVGVVDGVMSVDPEGLAALLRLTGGVDVADWPETITADNVVDVTLRDAYLKYPEDTEDRVSRALSRGQRNR